MRLILVDLSSIIHPIFHMSAAEQERDPNHVSTQTVAKVRSLIEGFDHVAICCDSGKSFRNEIDPDYKANRGEPNMSLIHQANLAQELLAEDGLVVWSCRGFEADDIIATAVAQASSHELDIVIASSDKDLLQLVAPGISALSIMTSKEFDEATVLEKFSVKPSQMADYLAMVGDAADNIKGIKGIGAKGAAKLLGTFGTAEQMFTDVEKTQGKATELTPKLYQLLQAPETLDTFVKAKQLILLATDAPIEIAEALAARESKAETEFMGEPKVERDDVVDVIKAASAQLPEVSTGVAVGAQVEVVDALPQSLAIRDFKMELEPRNQVEAIELARHMHASRLFSGFGTPQAVLATVMAGRELGMPSMAALRGFHVIDNKPTLSAGLIVALVLKSGLAEYFTCTVRTPEKATYITQRKGDPKPIELSFTIEEARDAGYIKPNSGWTRNPADMMVARAGAKLARLVYPDVTFGLYDPDEIRDSVGGGR